MSYRRYPMRNHRFVHDGRLTNHIVLRNVLTEETKGIPIEWAEVYFRLNGRTSIDDSFQGTPYTLDERKEILNAFRTEGLLETADGSPGDSNNDLLLPIVISIESPISLIQRRIAQMVTVFLEWIAFPLLFLSYLWCLLAPGEIPIGMDELGFGSWALTTIIGLPLTIIIHEVGHIIVGLANNVRTLEFGLWFDGLFGGYVLQDEKAKSLLNKPTNHSQIYAAGCEANAMLSAICLLCAKALGHGNIVGAGFELIAFYNLTALENMVYLPGINDGGNAIHLLYLDDRKAIWHFFWGAVVFFPISWWCAYCLFSQHWALFEAPWANALVSIPWALFFTNVSSYYVTRSLTRIKHLKNERRKACRQE